MSRRRPPSKGALFFFRSTAGGQGTILAYDNFTFRDLSVSGCCPPDARRRGHRMRLRDFLLFSTIVILFFAESAAVARAAEKVYRVGVLAPPGTRPIESFKERLGQLGWIEGRNLRFDYRS